MKKKKRKLKKRVENLEKEIVLLKRQSKALTYDWGEMDFPKLCRDLPSIIRNSIEASQKNAK